MVGRAGLDEALGTGQLMAAGLSKHASPWCRAVPWPSELAVLGQDFTKRATFLLGDGPRRSAAFRL